MIDAAVTADSVISVKRAAFSVVQNGARYPDFFSDVFGFWFTKSKIARTLLQAQKVSRLRQGSGETV